MELGKYGVWLQEPKWSPELAAAAEKLGFSGIWVGRSPGGELTGVESLLEATSGAVVGTSIVNVWKDDPATIAAAYHRLTERYPGRFLLGIGIGHREATQQYAAPYQTLVDYLDALDAAGLPAAGRALAALGPRVLRLARDRTAGALPYLTTPEHTRRAREALGPDALLVPEHKVVLETDPDRARAIGRPALRGYLDRVNYANNLRRLGYQETDIAEGGDELVDALALHGSTDTIVAGLRAHLNAGANHVAVEPLTDPADLETALAALAPELLR